MALRGYGDRLEKSQNQFARDVGIAAGALSKILNVERPGFELYTAWRMARILRVRLEWLITGQGEQELSAEAA